MMSANHWLLGIPKGFLTMQLFWVLLLIILIQLLESCWFNYKLNAEALRGLRNSMTISRHSFSRNEKERSPSLRKWNCVNYCKLKDGGTIFLSKKQSLVTRVDGDTSVPTFTPVQVVDLKKPSKLKAAAVGGGVGAVLILIVIGAIVYVCLMRLKRSISRAFDAPSSVPSPNVERGGVSIFPHATALSVLDPQILRKLTTLDLEHATGRFTESNIIGEGGFGLVYKGLLEDGSFVAIKRRLHYPIQNFVQEVRRIAQIQHRHLVKLIGYCEENHEQFLIYDYLPNGHVGNHLYDAEGSPMGKLDMRQRLFIALGAAKGLEHLHSSEPPILHMRFKTRNVLVDDKFTAKVSDYGFSRLLVETNHAGSSSSYDCFRDPELKSSTDFSDRSDVYSFGVFLFELISGREALCRTGSNMHEILVFQAQNYGLSYLVDKTLGDQVFPIVKQMMELMLLCIDNGKRRPSMKNIVEELDEIQEREIVRLQSDLSDGIGNVALGSELFM